MREARRDGAPNEWSENNESGVWGLCPQKKILKNHNHREVMAYGKRLQVNLYNLQEQICSGEVETGNYRYFTIYDPKKRLICAAPFDQPVFCQSLFGRRRSLCQRSLANQGFYSLYG